MSQQPLDDRPDDPVVAAAAGRTAPAAEPEGAVADLPGEPGPEVEPEPEAAAAGEPVEAGGAAAAGPEAPDHDGAGEAYDEAAGEAYDEAFDRAGVASDEASEEPYDAAADEVYDEADEAEAVEADLDALARLTAQRDEYLDALRRLQADFENYRKRMLRQQTEHTERAAESLVSKLLPVLDGFELAVAHGHPDVEPVYRSLVSVLEREGLERIDAEGAPFDPERHEAVAHEATGGDEEPEVVEVMRAGYCFKGRVLRPAMVKVRG